MSYIYEQNPHETTTQRGLCYLGIFGTIPKIGPDFLMDTFLGNDGIHRENGG